MFLVLDHDEINGTNISYQILLYGALDETELYRPIFRKPFAVSRCVTLITLTFTLCES